LVGPDHLAELLGVLLARSTQIVEIAAGKERALRRGDDHALDRLLLGLEPIDRLAERGHECLVHRVGRLAGVIQREHHDPVGTLLPANRAPGTASVAGTRAHRMASTTVAIPMPPPTHSVARP